jgi:hypothetical protein
MKKMSLKIRKDAIGGAVKRVFILAIIAVFAVSNQVVAQAAKNQSKIVDLELNKVYGVQGFKFTVQVVRILKDSYPMGMFSGRPSNPNMDPSYDGVLGIELTLKEGNSDVFSKLETYIVNEKGERNVKADMTGMSGASESTYLFNVPLSAKKIKFNIGGLELNLEKVLSKSEK